MSVSMVYHSHIMFHLSLTKFSVGQEPTKGKQELMQLLWKKKGMELMLKAHLISDV